MSNSLLACSGKDGPSSGEPLGSPGLDLWEDMLEAVRTVLQVVLALVIVAMVVVGYRLHDIY